MRQGIGAQAEPYLQGRQPREAPRPVLFMDLSRSGGRIQLRFGFGLRLLGLAGVLLFLASAFSSLPNMLASVRRNSSQLEPADAVVVLGAGIYPDGALTNGSVRRALNGIVPYRKGLAKFLVFSGPGWNGRNAESAVRAQLARDLGISPETILTETRARTTQEEAVRLGELLRSRGTRRILLVTDSQHLPRAQALFEPAGFEVLSAPADDFSIAAMEPEERLRVMRRVAQEILARVYYRLAGYL